MKSSCIPISVIIITKNRPQLFQRCMRSVCAQRRPPNQIVIIDSSKEKAQYLIGASIHTRITYVYRPLLSIPQARAFAIQFCKYSQLLFLDDDCILSQDVPYKIHAYLSRYKNKQLIMGDLQNDSPQNPFCVAQHFFYNIWMRENFRKDIAVQSFSNGMPLHFDLLGVRKSYLTRAVFDMNAPSIFQDDDLDIGVQLFRLGGEMVFDRSLPTLYRPRSSLSSLLRRSFYTGFSNQYLIARKRVQVEGVPYPLSLGDKLSEVFIQVRVFARAFSGVVFVASLVLSSVFYKLGKAYYYVWSTAPRMLQRSSQSSDSSVTRGKRRRSILKGWVLGNTTIHDSRRV